MNSRRPEVTNERRKFHEFGTTAPEDETQGVERLAFGPFLLDPETGRLSEGERVVPLAPKPFETLLYLARRPGKVVSKAELIEALWPDTYVTEDVLVQSIVEIRKALGDHAKDPRYVQTLPRRGYQFLETVRTVGPEGQETPLSGAAVVAHFPVEVVRAPASPPKAPRRWPPWAAGIAVLGLLALGAWMMWRGRPPAPGPDPSLAAADRDGLVVMPIRIDEAEPQSAWLRQGLAEMLRSQLGQTPGLHVVARHRLAAALAAAGVDEASPTGESEAVAITRGLSATWLVTGSFVRVQERFVLSAQVTDVGGGAPVGNAAVRGRYPEELLDAVDELCQKLVPLLAAERGGFKPMRLATRSVDASRHYVEALVWFARGGRRGAEEAEKRLDAALRLDSAFAQAYLKKAEIQHWRRRWGYGEPDPAPAVRAASALLAGLSAREQLLVKSYVALLLQRDESEAISLWRSLLRLYPTYAEEAGIPSLTAETLQLEGRWDDVIDLGEAHVQAPSLPDGERARLSGLLANAFRRKGEFARALEHARRAVRLWPSPNGPEFLWQRAQLGRILLETGRADEALEAFRAVAGASDAEARNLTDAGWGLYMAGDSAAALAQVERALELDPGYGNAYHLRGWLRLAGGQAAAAAADFEAAWDKTPRAFGAPHQGLVQGDLAALYYAGVAREKAGQEEQARAAFERLLAQCHLIEAQPGADPAESPFWQAASFRARALARLGRAVIEPPRLKGDDTTYFVQSARLLAVSGQGRRALEDLAHGLALGHGERRHVRDDPDFESLRGDPEFRRLTADVSAPTSGGPR